MMLEPIYKTKFKKDLKLMEKRGKSIDKLKAVIRQLIEEKPLEVKYNDHPLKGNYVDTRECHIEPDWLLVYMIKDDSITFVRTGSHADLFK
jgi:mRNA interferase YafQ